MEINSHVSAHGLLLNGSYSKIIQKSYPHKITEGVIPVVLDEKPTFHVVGYDKLNPWQADSYAFTPADISPLSQKYRIFATPHVGIHWSSNSMYSYMGVKICDFTGNQSVKDTDDMPEYLGYNGKLVRSAIQKNQILSPYLKLDKDVLGKLSGGLQGYYSCNNLGFIHHSVKRKTIGEDNVLLDKDILSSFFVPKLLAVLEKNEKYILADYPFAKKIFNRFVDKDGVVCAVSEGESGCHIDSFLRMKEAHWKMILHDESLCPSGHLVLKEVVIMCDAIRCFLSSLSDLLVQGDDIGDTFLMSGISMIHYLKNPHIREVMQKMYEVLQPEFSWLPKHMRMFVLPGGLFRFLPSSGEPELEKCTLTLLNLYKEICEKDKQLTLCQSSEVIAQRKKIIKDHFVPAKKFFVLHYKQRRSFGFNQYDLLNGESVNPLIPALLMDHNFHHIKTLFEVIEEKPKKLTL